MKELAPAGTPLRQAVEAINSLIRGRSNAVRRVTLATGTTQTIITADNLNENAEVVLIPRTASAKAEPAYAYVERVSGTLQVTIKHASSATADRTFGVLVIGG